VKILERYNTAVHASSLKPDANTTYADLDVIGAAGLAARYEPMGIALARMLSGGGARAVLTEMTDAVHERSFRIRERVSVTVAENIAKAVLAWWRDGVCHPCSGTGFELIAGTPSLGGECKECGGTGKRPLDKSFRQEHKELARWLSGEIERCQANAGQIAMRKIAPSLDL
jgi:hypothetical protein